MKNKLISIFLMICIITCGFNNKSDIGKEFITYPDFITKDKYTLDEINEFCDENNITLVLDYIEGTDYSSGTILTQSIEMGSKVIEGSTLKITVAK